MAVAKRERRGLGGARGDVGLTRVASSTRGFRTRSFNACGASRSVTCAVDLYGGALVGHGINRPTAGAETAA
jgi:hypothetical protein